ncbi:MAG TPA: glycosyltransferase 87 family protein [Chloroflexota bacterium]
MTTALRNATRGTTLADSVEAPAGRRGSLLGLMGRASLPVGHCLLLPGTRGVQTHFMRFAIDVIFYGRDGTVLDVVRGLQPWRFSSFLRQAAGALELPAGAADGTFPGDVLQLAEDDQEPQGLSVVPGRLERMLTWKRSGSYAGFVGLIFLAAWAYSTFAGTAPLTRAGEPIMGDYVAFYAAGRMVLTGSGANIYDPTAVRQAQAEATQGQVADLYDPLRNPPFVALAFAPLALLDPLPSFVVWSLINLLALAAAMWLTLDTLPSLRRHWPWIALIALAFAPVYRGLIGGQNANLSLLLFVLIYRAVRQQHHARAGGWAAIGLFKPQLFLVFPIIFAASRRWRALAVYALVATGLGLVSLAVIGGPAGIPAWISVIVDHESGNALRNAYRMHSLKAFFDLLLPGQSGLALGLYLLGSLALLVPLARLWTNPPGSDAAVSLRWALTSVVAVLIDPHLIDYDLTVLVLAALLLGAAHASGRVWVLVFYLVSLFALLFDLRLPYAGVQVQITVPVLVMFAGWTWRELARLDVRPAQSRLAAVHPGTPTTSPVTRPSTAFAGD